MDGYSNPLPPPEAERPADSTGSAEGDATSVDESYLLALLIKLLPETHQRRDGSSVELSVEGQVKNYDDTCVAAEEVRDAEAIEAGCIIWDLCSVKQHCQFFLKSNLPRVALLTLSSGRSARLQEVCVGILANMCLHVSVTHLGGPGLASTMRRLVFTSTEPTLLTQAYRLMECALSQKGLPAYWDFVFDTALIQRTCQILNNSLIDSVIERIIPFLCEVGGEDKGLEALCGGGVIPAIITFIDSVTVSRPPLIPHGFPGEETLSRAMYLLFALRSAPSTPSACSPALCHSLIRSALSFDETTKASHALHALASRVHLRTLMDSYEREIAVASLLETACFFICSAPRDREDWSSMIDLEAQTNTALWLHIICLIQSFVGDVRNDTAAPAHLISAPGASVQVFVSVLDVFLHSITRAEGGTSESLCLLVNAANALMSVLEGVRATTHVQLRVVSNTLFGCASRLVVDTEKAVTPSTPPEVARTLSSLKTELLAVAKRLRINQKI